MSGSRAGSTGPPEREPTRPAGRWLAEGQDALRRYAWDEARRAFEGALVSQETAEALEGLAASVCWDDVPAAIGARQAAFRAYQQRGDARSAARVATRLGIDIATYHAEFAVADGWFSRAHRLLDGLDPGPEHAWLALWEATIAMHVLGDSDRGRALAARGAALSRELGLPDAALIAVGLEGLELVDEGRIGEGLKLLDEAATASLTGELPDLEAGGYACCYVLTTCERVRDYDRAMQWLDRVVAHHRQIRTGRLLALCRGHLVGVLTWRGEWEKADEEMEAVLREAGASAAFAAELRLRRAELRRLQGRFEEAAELLRAAEGHPSAHLGWAALAFEQGDFQRTIDCVDRYFRGTRSSDRLPRAAGEVLLVKAHAVRREAGPAAAALARLREVAADPGAGGLPAELRACEGALALAEERLEDARRSFEDAIDLFARGRNPYEVARSRLSLSDVLRRLGRASEARAEAARAKEAFDSLGARAGSQRAGQALEREAKKPQEATDTAGLSPRQLDVLRLLARGLSNREIGERLFVSEFTVKRHVADILARLDLPTRAAAAAWAAERRIT